MRKQLPMPVVVAAVVVVLGLAAFGITKFAGRSAQEAGDVSSNIQDLRQATKGHELPPISKEQIANDFQGRGGRK